MPITIYYEDALDLAFNAASLYAYLVEAGRKILNVAETADTLLIGTETFRANYTRFNKELPSKLSSKLEELAKENGVSFMAVNGAISRIELRRRGQNS
ncbi:MAG: hypothetical protein AABX07_05565 [Nanoarchaeota archaeon]